MESNRSSYGGARELGVPCLPCLKPHRVPQILLNTGWNLKQNYL